MSLAFGDAIERVPRRIAVVSVLLLVGVLGGCRSPVPFRGKPGPDAPVVGLGAPVPYLRPGHPAPPVVDQRGGLTSAPADVYAATRAGMFSAAAEGLPHRVYVPDSSASSIDLVDTSTYRVVRRVAVGRAPQQVVPSWDLKKLWVIESTGLVPINARTGKVGRTVATATPSDLYFSPDGREALLLDAARGRIEIRAPDTMRYRSAVQLPCAGLTHADFSAGGGALVVGCSGSGRLVRVDLARRKATGTLKLATDADPQDVRLSPDGTTFYVADSGRGGVWLVDAARFRAIGFIRTGRGAQSLTPSRDASLLYVANGGAHTVSLISFARHRLLGHWRLPAAPDTIGVSASGQVAWVSTPKANLVYAVSARTGKVLHKIPVGAGPRGLCVHPQPGRFSLGHTGNYR